MDRSCVALMLAIAAALAPGISTGQVNQPPDITLPSPAPDTTLGAAISFSPVVSDPDVGAGNMEMEIDISDVDGVGGLSVANGDYGRFTWGFGTAVTSDVAIATRTNLNAALANFTFTPRVGFAGFARIIFEIDDQGNSGSGGVLSRTRFIDIDVCAPSESGLPACATNNQPDIALPSGLSAPPGQALSFAPVVSDVDVGPGQMEMEIDISDLDGAGPLSVAAGDYGRFSWGLGTNVTSDVAVATLGQINAALSSFTYTSPPGYSGIARIIFEIDDQGNSGNTNSVLSRTRFIDITVLPSAGEVRFANGCTLTVGEGDTVAIAVERINGSGGAASVQIAALAGTASTPADFSFVPSQANWSDGQAGVRSAGLQIAADAIQEPTEFLTLLLGAATGASVIAPSVKTVFIRNIPAAQLVFSDGIEGNCED